MGTHLAGGIDGVRKGCGSSQGEPDLLASDPDLFRVQAARNVAEPRG